MTKWARMRKRRKERRVEESKRSESGGKEVKLTEPENISEGIQQSPEIEKFQSVKTSKPNYGNNPITKKIFVEHISVILIFSVLTVIFTFPVILDFASEAAGFGCYDKCHMMWRFWWADFSFDNGLDFWHSNYIFYPDGTNIAGNLAYFTTFIGFLLVQFLDYVTVWNVIWFLGLVFGGYGCYLLANNFNKNYLSSIIAGIIFTFTTYHLGHSQAHVGLSMIVWLPIFVLFLFKLLEKQSKYYSIVGGIIFFLVSLTHLYYSVFITMFSIIFFAVYIFRQKKVSNKTFITNFSILFTIGLISTSVLFLSNPTSNDELPDRILAEHIQYSTNLENLILPVPEHTTQVLSDSGMFISFYAFFDKTAQQLQIENLVFLGYSVIFLSALAVIRYRRNHIWFWLLICGIFILMSLGPELKIFNESTGIVMPDKLFYDTVPGWDQIRAPARFIVMANLALAVLVSYTVYGLIKSKFSSFKQQLMLTTIIGFVILFEFSMIPFPSYSEPIPDIYAEIKSDDSKFAVLPVPIGGVGDLWLMSDPYILYHQIHHEKPIYGGHESRPSAETMMNTRTYFLNMFNITGSEYDIIKQDLSTHGLSLFDHFDIKYVTLHKELSPSYGHVAKTLRDVFVPEIRQVVSEILGEDNPIYEDDRIVVYKIPKPNSSEPFLLLGSGWHIFEPEYNARASMKSSEVLIVNPTNSDMDVTLNLILNSIGNKKTMMVSVNNEKLDTFNIPATPTDIQIELILVSGVNVVTLDTDDFTLSKGKTVSFAVKSISIIN